MVAKEHVSVIDRPIIHTHIAASTLFAFSNSPRNTSKLDSLPPIHPSSCSIHCSGLGTSSPCLLAAPLSLLRRLADHGNKVHVHLQRISVFFPEEASLKRVVWLGPVLLFRCFVRLVIDTSLQRTFYDSAKRRNCKKAEFPQVLILDFSS